MVVSAGLSSGKPTLGSAAFAHSLRLRRACPTRAQPAAPSILSGVPDRLRGGSSHALSDVLATCTANPYSWWSGRGNGSFPRFFLVPQVRYFISITAVFSVKRRRQAEDFRAKFL